MSLRHSLRLFCSFSPSKSLTSRPYLRNRNAVVSVRCYFPNRRNRESTSVKLCPFPKRTAVTATVKMAQEESQQLINGPETTVIRYQQGDERFQMQVTLHTGKVLNFERKASDSVANVLARMETNIGKKVKNFGGTLKFLRGNGSEAVAEEDKEVTPMEKLLTLAVKEGLKIQVDNYVYSVVLNPPEFYSAKFFSVYMPTFPLFPYKMETSGNFSKETSLYKWAFTQEKPTPPTPPPKSKKKANKTEDNGPVIATIWTECGSSLMFTPTPEMMGMYLRFSCTPSSNGTVFGKPFSMILPNPIQPLPVDNFLFQERLSRLAAKKEEAFRVLTYNVLADTYATPEWFISSPKDSLDVGYRLPILNKEIKSYEADLILLQEVDEKYFEGNFEPFLAMEGYKGRHLSKIGNTKEGIATFHNPAKFTELEHHQYVILEEMKALPLWQRLTKVPKDFTSRLEERNTVFHVSIFRLNQCPEGSILIASNVHLYFHPDADHIRLLQTITCLSIMEKVVARVKSENPGKRVAVIYSGDLNCTPPFSSYRLLTTGQLQEDDEDWTSHPEEKILPGISVEHSLKLSNSHPDEELTNITTCFEGCLDYILYQAEHLELISTCPPPSKETIAAITKVDEPRKVSLPNFYTPSDHLPLIADFKIKSK